MKSRITASSPDLSETASFQASAQPQQQNKTRSDAQSLHSNDERHERPNQRGLQRIVDKTHNTNVHGYIFQFNARVENM